MTEGRKMVEVRPVKELSSVFYGLLDRCCFSTMDQKLLRKLLKSFNKYSSLHISALLQIDLNTF